MARHWHTVVVLTGQGDGVLHLCHSRAWLPREESRILGACACHSWLRSRHSGLIDSINLIFCLRVMLLISFSRAIAWLMSLNSSKYTKRLTLYRAVNEPGLPSLCSPTRRSRSLVTPA